MHEGDPSARRSINPAPGLARERVLLASGADARTNQLGPRVGDYTAAHEERNGMSKRNTERLQDRNTDFAHRDPPAPVSRRAFLKNAAGIATATAAVAAIGIEPLLRTKTSEAKAAGIALGGAQPGAEASLRPPNGTYAPLSHLRRRRNMAYALRT